MKKRHENEINLSGGNILNSGNEMESTKDKKGWIYFSFSQNYFRNKKNKNSLTYLHNSSYG